VVNFKTQLYILQREIWTACESQSENVSVIFSLV